MKKLLLVTVALILASSASMVQAAEEAPSPAKEMVQGVGNATEFVGKVISVTLAQPAKGVTDGTVKVADKMGNPISYTVNSAAVITDASLNVITLNQLKKGETVKVQAVAAKNGDKKATSITKM